MTADSEVTLENVMTINPTPIDIHLNVDTPPLISGNTDCVLSYTDQDRLDGLKSIFESLRSYLFEDAPIGKFVKQCRDIGTLFSPRDNSTFRLRVQISDFAESTFKAGSSTKNLNSVHIARCAKDPDVTDPFSVLELNEKLVSTKKKPNELVSFVIPVENGGVLKTEGFWASSTHPTAYLSEDLIILFSNRGVAHRIITPSSGDLDLSVEGELFRSGRYKDMSIEWYLSNSVKDLTVGDQTWRVTKSDAVVLPDKVAGEDTPRMIGYLFVAKNIETKERRVIPNIAGIVSVLYRNVIKIKEEGSDFPEQMLVDIKSLDHVEAKRILMNTVGTEKFLLNAETLDVDIDSRIHRALQQKLLGLQSMLWWAEHFHAFGLGVDAPLEAERAISFEHIACGGVLFLVVAVEVLADVGDVTGLAPSYLAEAIGRPLSTYDDSGVDQHLSNAVARAGMVIVPAPALATFLHAEAFDQHAALVQPDDLNHVRVLGLLVEAQVHVPHAVIVSGLYVVFDLQEFDERVRLIG